MSQQRMQGHQRRIVEIARARGHSMDQLLQYNITPCCLFDEEGLMTKAVKSSLVHELELRLSADDCITSSRPTDTFLHTTYIVDTMANIRKMKTNDLKTFGDFALVFTNYIMASAKGANRIDLIFDSYCERSIKDHERQRRQNLHPIELNLLQEDTPLPIEMNRFWTSNQNKCKLQALQQ